MRDNALTNAEVGEYMADHFAATSQKIGTFRIVNEQKVGGNVASYFLRPDGTVLHAIPGKVDAATFLREARFAVELNKLALLHGEGSTLRQKLVVAEGHGKRVLLVERQHNGNWAKPALTTTVDRQIAENANNGVQAQLCAVLAVSPLPKLAALYPVVWEKILNERVDLSPVEKK